MFSSEEKRARHELLSELVLLQLFRWRKEEDLNGKKKTRLRWDVVKVNLAARD